MMKIVQRSAARSTTSAGFIITLEFLLVMVLFVLPVMIGLFLLGRKLFTLYLNQREFEVQPYSRAVVWDSSATVKVIGPVVGYDQFEAPLVVFRDDATKGGVLLGTRRDRFTSVGQVFYTDNNCTQTPRIRAWDSSLTTGKLGPTLLGAGYPPAGFAYQMQRRSYAMGKGNILYQSPTAGGVTMTSGAPPLYAWASQDTKPPSPADPFPPCFRVQNGVVVENLVDATVVIDLDGPGNYVAPFRMAFPTPSGTLAPLPFGETP